MKISKNEMIITIDSELGINADRIGEKISQILHIPCYGKEILKKASEISKIPLELLERYDGRTVRAAYDLQAEDTGSLLLPPAAEFIAAQLAAVRELSKSGACILVDRHATGVLQGNENRISIYIHANTEDRAKAYGEQKGLSEKQALRVLKRADRAYRRYYKGTFRGWGEADSYDLTINASDAKTGDVAEIIVSMLETLTGMQLRKQTDRKAG